MTDVALGRTPERDLDRAAGSALVLGVLNVVCFGPLAGVPAVVLGLRAWSAGWKAQLAVGLGVAGSLWWTLAAVALAG